MVKIKKMHMQFEKIQSEINRMHNGSKFTMFNSKTEEVCLDCGTWIYWCDRIGKNFPTIFNHAASTEDDH